MASPLLVTVYWRQTVACRRSVGAVEALFKPTNQTKHLLKMARAWSDVVPLPLPVQTCRTARQLREEEIDKLVTAFEGGVSIRKLAAKFGIYRTTVGQHLRARGVDTHNFALQPEDVAAAAKLYESGWSVAQLAKRYKVGNETMRARLVTAGIEMRGRGRPTRVNRHMP